MSISQSKIPKCSLFTWPCGTVAFGRTGWFTGSTRFDRLFLSLLSIQAYEYDLSQLLLMVMMMMMILMLEFVAKKSIHK